MEKSPQLRRERGESRQAGQFPWGLKRWDNTNRALAFPNETKQKNLYFIIFHWCDTAILCWRRGSSPALDLQPHALRSLSQRGQLEGKQQDMVGFGCHRVSPHTFPSAPYGAVLESDTCPHAPHHLQGHFITITISVHLSLASYFIITLCSWHLQITWHKNSICSIFTSSQHRLVAENTFPTRKQKDENERQMYVPNGSWLCIYVLF